MTPSEMEALIEAHLRADGNGDPEGAVANYTADIEHDVVGFPGSPLRRIPATLGFYGQLVKDVRTDGEEPLPAYYVDDAVIIKNLITATVAEQFLGIHRAGKQVRFRAVQSSSFEVAGSPGRTSGSTALGWPPN